MQNKIRYISFHLALFTLILFAYLTHIVDSFGYMGGFKTYFNAAKCFTSVITFVGVIYFIKASGKPSEFFLHCIVALILGPTLVIYTASDLPHLFAVYSLACCLIVIWIPQMFPLRRTAGFAALTKEKLSWIVVVMVVAITAATVYFAGGVSVAADYTAFHEPRRDVSGRLPTIVGYLYSTANDALIPLGVALGCARRRFGVVVVLALCGILLGMSTHNKAPLVVGMVSATLYFIGCSSARVIAMLVLLITLTVAGITEWFALKEAGYITSLFTHRAIFIPSQINFAYVQFFEENLFTLWSQSRISLGLFAKPYGNITHNFLIGFETFGAVDMSANTGWIGSGFANAGIAGGVVYSALFGTLLAVIDSARQSDDVGLTVAAWTMMVIGCIARSADFTNVLITHGLIILLLLYFSFKPARRQHYFSSGVGIAGSELRQET